MVNKSRNVQYNKFLIQWTSPIRTRFSARKLLLRENWMGIRIGNRLDTLTKSSPTPSYNIFILFGNIDHILTYVCVYCILCKYYIMWIIWGSLLSYKWVRICHRNLSKDINGAGKTLYKFKIHSFVEWIVAAKL